MSQDQSFIWKSSLGGPVSWVGRSLRGSPGQGTVLARLMESQIWNLLGTLWEEGSEKEQWPLPTFLSGRKLLPKSRLETRYFSSFLYATGAFQAATPVLELRWNGSE